VNFLLLGLIVLALGIAFLGYAAKIATDMVQGIANGVFGIGIDIINLLGRRRLGRRAIIPDILTVPFDSSKADAERENMKHN
jgi:hypothetical protein